MQELGGAFKSLLGICGQHSYYVDMTLSSEIYKIRYTALSAETTIDSTGSLVSISCMQSNLHYVATFYRLVVIITLDMHTSTHTQTIWL